MDLQATKNFEITENVSAFARVDVLNLFNFRNFSSVNVGSQNGELFSSYSHTGDFTGVPRTVKVEVGVRF